MVVAGAVGVVALPVVVMVVLVLPVVMVMMMFMLVLILIMMMVMVLMLVLIMVVMLMLMVMVMMFMLVMIVIIVVVVMMMVFRLLGLVLGADALHQLVRQRHLLHGRQNGLAVQLIPGVVMMAASAFFSRSSATAACSFSGLTFWVRLRMMVPAVSIWLL